jgi:methyl acetate hydrolase
MLRTSAPGRRHFVASKSGGFMTRASLAARFSIAICIAVVVTVANAQTSTAPIDEALRSAIARSDVPGVVALVTDRKGVLYRGAFGVADVQSKRQMTVDSMFRIASMTKAVTSVALMQLVEQGKLGVDDPADMYLPELSKLPVFQSFDAATGDYRLRPSTKPITVRHLLTHTSGLGYPFTSAILRDFKPRAGESYANGPLLFEPGERWHYGTSTDVVGRLVEKISGEKLEDYFLRHILTPLKMVDTSYNIPEAKAARVVASQQRDGERMDGKIVLQSPQPALTVATPIGGGGLTSTADDYGRFVRMLLNEGALDGVRVLKSETVALMGRNAIGNVSVPALKTAMPRSADFTFIADGRDKWGLGFLITVDHVPDKRAAGSLSWGGINNTYYWIDPSNGLAGVIMMQYLPFADAKALAVYDAFERAVYKTLAPEHGQK